jgi:hypothetical protein
LELLLQAKIRKRRLLEMYYGLTSFDDKMADVFALGLQNILDG